MSSSKWLEWCVLCVIAYYMVEALEYTENRFSKLTSNKNGVQEYHILQIKKTTTHCAGRKQAYSESTGVKFVSEFVHTV